MRLSVFTARPFDDHYLLIVRPLLKAEPVSYRATRPIIRTLTPEQTPSGTADTGSGQKRSLLKRLTEPTKSKWPAHDSRAMMVVTYRDVSAAMPTALREPWRLKVVLVDERG